MGKIRLNITVDEDLHIQMSMIKAHYGGFSGLISQAVTSFLKEPVTPYETDVKAYHTSIERSEALSLDEIDWDAESR